MRSYYELTRLFIIPGLFFLCGCRDNPTSDQTVYSIDITSVEDYEKLYADNPETAGSVADIPEKQPASTTSDTKKEGSETPAYDLGRQCAMRLIRQCETESEIRDELLDIRAREHGLRTRVGTEAAEDYISGFKSALKESGDTLYKTLFES